MAPTPVSEPLRDDSRSSGDRWGRAGFNLLILVGGALPLWIVAEWLQALVFPPPESGSTGWGKFGDAAQMFVLEFFAMGIPLLFGGVLHQAALLVIPKSWSRRVSRATILVTSPLVGVFLVAMTGNPEQFFSPCIVAPTMLALAFYGLVAKRLH